MHNYIYTTSQATNTVYVLPYFIPMFTCVPVMKTWPTQQTSKPHGSEVYQIFTSILVARWHKEVCLLLV